MDISLWRMMPSTGTADPRTIMTTVSRTNASNGYLTDRVQMQPRIETIHEIILVIVFIIQLIIIMIIASSSYRSIVIVVLFFVVRLRRRGLVVVLVVVRSTFWGAILVYNIVFLKINKSLVDNP